GPEMEQSELPAGHLARGDPRITLEQADPAPEQVEPVEAVPDQVEVGPAVGAPEAVEHPELRLVRRPRIGLVALEVRRSEEGRAPVPDAAHGYVAADARLADAVELPVQVVE